MAIIHIVSRMRVGIVGGGIIGYAAAFELARRGADVTVFDMRDPGAGATLASAGMLAPYIEGHDNEALLALTVRGLDVYDDFVNEVRRVADIEFEYRRSGSIEVAGSEDRARLLLSRVTPLLQARVVEWLDAVQVGAREPALRTNQCGGLLCRLHGYVTVGPFMAALVRACERTGVAFRFGRVDDICFDDEECRVKTADGRSAVDRIVLSTGSWASLLDPLNEIRGAIRPIRGQLLVLSWPAAPLQHIVWGQSCYIVPWRDGTLLVGATSEDVGFDERATVHGVTALLAAAGELLQDLGKASFLEVRVGLRPASASGMPFMGPSAEDPRLVYATGHFRNGVLLAPLTARLIAGYLLDGQTDPAFENGA